MIRLNPKGKCDQEIIILIDKVPTLTDQIDMTDLNDSLDYLTVISQNLLKIEWDRVRKETKKGKESKI